MQRADLKELWFSQRALQSYTTCQRQFRYRYVDQLYWPNTWFKETQEVQALKEGEQFHLLAARYYEGLPPGKAALVEGMVGPWFSNLQAFLPATSGGTFLPEQELRVMVEGHRLLAKFDLLRLLSNGQVVLYEWKTGPRIPGQGYGESIQTRFYCYLLAAAGEVLTGRTLSPQDITMVYWNPRFPQGGWSQVYNQEKFDRDRDMIHKQIAEIISKGYEHFLPTPDQKDCSGCEYWPLCNPELTKRAVDRQQEVLESWEMADTDLYIEC